MPSGSLSNLVTGIMALCALTVTGLIINREVSPPPWPPKPGVVALSSHVVEQREEIEKGGHRLGSSSAPVTLAVFSDFECPACGYFANGVLGAIRAQFQDSIAIVIRHLPISYHRFAYPAARASECAASQGRFEEFYELVFRKQDSLGLKSFWSYAEESGVRDSAAFNRCNETPGALPQIDADAALARRAGATGTPTILIDGQLFSSVPDSAELAQAILEHLRQKRVTTAGSEGRGAANGRSK